MTLSYSLIPTPLCKQEWWRKRTETKTIHNFPVVIAYRTWHARGDTVLYACLYRQKVKSLWATLNATVILRKWCNTANVLYITNVNASDVVSINIHEPVGSCAGGFTLLSGTRCWPLPQLCDGSGCWKGGEHLSSFASADAPLVDKHDGGPPALSTYTNKHLERTKGYDIRIGEIRNVCYVIIIYR